MLSKYVIAGDKIDIMQLSSRSNGHKEEKTKTFYSQVYDILSEDRIEIVMPMEQSRILLLPVGAEYKLCFYTGSGLYQCRAKVKERYKKSNVYLLLMEITSQLNKHQRREYYRFNCAIDIKTRTLAEEELIEQEDGNLLYQPDKEKPMQKGIIVDISGGGIRFVSDADFERNERIICKFGLVIAGKPKEYDVVTEVLYIRNVENKKGLQEYRTRYVYISAKEREEIIRYIFEEERRYRKREKGE